MTLGQLDRSPILRNDPGRVGQSLDRLSDQLRDGWRQAQHIKLPGRYNKIDRVAVAGMGGSHLGADILRSALSAELKVPLTIIAEYRLPAWVNRHTLVIASSYSGTTEETLAAAQQADMRGAAIVVVSGGGPLAVWAKRKGYPLYQYQPNENPSGQPRLGVAYGLMAMLAMFRRLGLVKTPLLEISELPAVAWEATKRYGQKQPAKRNLAKQIALDWEKSIPLLVGAEWAGGNLHTLTNQIHENGKTYADYKLLPDLNHHLLEGLRNRAVTKNIHVLMVADDTYLRRNTKRMKLTAALCKKLGARVTVWKPRSTTKLSKAIELLAFGGYISWYLSAVRGVRPAAIPTVDWLKAKLSRGG